MTKLELRYLLTKLGRQRGYVGLLKESEIDDSVRAVFTVLRRENIPILTEYIYTDLKGQISYSDIQKALKKLIRTGLVNEWE